MGFSRLGVWLAAALAIVLLVAAPNGSHARQKSCKLPTGTTAVARSSQAVVFVRKTGDVGDELTTFYGCAKRVGRRVRLWKCDAGQLTSDRLQTVRLKDRAAILEIERRPEESATFFHLTRRVNLRTGKRRDTRSTSRPQPPGSKPILDC